MSARRPVRSAGAAVAALVVGVVFSAAAQATPGDLDLTFSGDGKQRTDFASGSSDAEAMVLQPDGKIVAVGYSGADFALARYNPNGTLDPSFSGNGRQTTGVGGGSAVANAVALQADGKIVVVGNTEPADFALARYNPNGTLDTSFSGDGKQTTDMGAIGQGATGVAIQADGRIVAVGEAGPGPGSTSTDFALARYNPDGTLDPSFSGDGKRRTDFRGSSDFASGVALQADGKIVAVGRVSGTTAGENDFALARYNPDGSLDTTFSGGKPTTDFGGGDEATAVAIQGNGKIVVVGNTEPGDFALARYDPNGTLDPSFSGDGKRRTDFGGGSGEATGVALQADGKIVAVGRGSGTTAGEHDFALVRYNPDGSLDTTFSGGKPMTDFGGGDEATAVATQGNGKIVAVGDTETQAGGSDFALARYDPNGALDPSFSGDGRQTTSFSGSDVANGVALQADGKIVVVGDTEPGEFALTRYNPNGTLDTTFSGDGKQTTDFTDVADVAGATDVALQADGKIVVVGFTRGPRFSADFALARYNPDGTLDPSFSGDGRQTTSFSGTGETASGVVLQADGKIVVGGTAEDALEVTSDFALARYNPNGTLDPSFSGDGRQTTDFGGWDGAGGVALQGNGTIVAVGLSGPDTSPGSSFALARYNPNGSLDPSFSGDGKQTTSFSGFDGANGVALQGDGKMVAVGHNGPGDFALARYNPNGSLDPSFSGDGKQTTDFGFGGDGASEVAIQANGKFVAVGFASGWATGNDFALARYDPNGTLDPSFSGDGKRRTDFGGSDDFASGVALQGDGRIVVVGRGLGTDGTSDFALARYLGG